MMSVNSQHLMKMPASRPLLWLLMVNALQLLATQLMSS